MQCRIGYGSTQASDLDYMRLEGFMILELRNIKKEFGNVSALKGVNLSVKEGEILGIIGLSGAGKSTIIRTMNLLELPTEGEVFYKGKDICKIDRRELTNIRRRVAMIFQGFHLLNQRTVLQNVLFPLEINRIPKKDALMKATEVLERVGLLEKKDAYPAQLSGGQKQRVAIARALASNPEIILCDEATSALDPETTGIILDLLRGINREFGITVVLVTHEMDVVNRICTEVAIVDGGIVVEKGKTKEIFKNPETAIAKKLVLGYAGSPLKMESFEGEKLIRLTFDDTTYDPIIANMVLSSGLPVNIMFADTKYIAGKTVGQMIIKLPKSGWKKHIDYLTAHGIAFENFEGDLENVIV